MREPGGAVKRLINAREERARRFVIGELGPLPVPEIVHRMLVPPAANAAGNVVFGLRQGAIRRAIIRLTSYPLEPVWST